MNKYLGIVPMTTEIESLIEIDQTTFDEIEVSDKIIVNGEFFVVSKVSKTSISMFAYDTNKITEIVFEKEEGIWNYKETKETEISGKAKGLVVTAEEDITLESPNPSWTVPNLTKEQVKTIFNSLKLGTPCFVYNADKDVLFSVVIGDISSGKECIVVQHYWLGYVEYQTTTEGVEIIGHEIIQEE